MPLKPKGSSALMFWSSNMIVWFSLKVNLNSNVSKHKGKQSCPKVSAYPVQGKNYLYRKVKRAVLCTSIFVPAYIVNIKYLMLLWMEYDTIIHLNSSGRGFQSGQDDWVCPGVQGWSLCAHTPPLHVHTAHQAACGPCGSAQGQGCTPVQPLARGTEMPVRCPRNWSSPGTALVYTLSGRELAPQ